MSAPDYAAAPGNLQFDAFVETTRRSMRDEGLTAEDDLTPEEAAQVGQMRRDMGRLSSVFGETHEKGGMLFGRLTAI